MALRFSGWRMNSPAYEAFHDSIIDEDSNPDTVAVETSPHYEIIESVLKTADEIAETIEPGNTFELSLDDIVQDGPDVDLDLELPMEAGNHNLMVVEIGARVVRLQVCRPSDNPAVTAAD